MDSGWGGPGTEGSASRSMTSPATRRRLFATAFPLTSTEPAPISVPTSARDQPVSRVTARSTRSPSRAPGTSSGSVTPSVMRSLDGLSVAQREDEQQHDADRHGGVGPVEAG